MGITRYKFQFSYNKYLNGNIYGCGIKLHEQECGVLDQKDMDNVINDLETDYRDVGIVVADVKLI